LKITTSDLKQDRQWRAAIGINKKQFYILLPAFKNAYFEIYKNELTSRKVGTGIDYCIQNEEELLLFTLLSFKSGLTYDLLGVICGMNGSNAQKNQKIGLSVLIKTLNNLNMMPERKLLTVKDFEELFKEETNLIFDATEQRIQRPGNPEKQKEIYSGKKIQYSKIHANFNKIKGH